jgi:hypothetical protein
MSATHEAFTMHWEPKLDHLVYAIGRLLNRERQFVSDVGFYWINHVEKAMKYLPDPKFICLKRDKRQVVASFDKRTPMTSYWTSPISKHWDWDKYELNNKMLLFPQYDLPKKLAIARYWEDYYWVAKYLEKRFPDNFKVFSMRYVLNTAFGQREMMEFAGVENPTINKNIWENKSTQCLVVKTRLPVNDKKTVCGQCKEKTAEVCIHNKTSNMLMYTCEGCVETAEKRLVDIFEENLNV